MHSDQSRLESCCALKVAWRRRERSSFRKAPTIGPLSCMKDTNAHRMLLMCCSDSSCAITIFLKRNAFLRRCTLAPSAVLTPPQSEN